jgi:hypothetical protein
MKRENKIRRNNSPRDLRRIAEHYAAGLQLQKSSAEAQRLIRLAINEAEALASQTGVPELVLPMLAEEKVQALERWAARQKSVREREQAWGFAA